MDEVWSPIERACRNLARLHGSGPDDQQTSRGEDRPAVSATEHWEEFLADVRIVLEAIREPTDEMIREGYYAWQENISRTLYHVTQAQWRVQVDKLLRDVRRHTSARASEQNNEPRTAHHG